MLVFSPFIPKIRGDFSGPTDFPMPETGFYREYPLKRGSASAERPVTTYLRLQQRRVGRNTLVEKRNIDLDPAISPYAHYPAGLQNNRPESSVAIERQRIIPLVQHIRAIAVRDQVFIERRQQAHRICSGRQAPLPERIRRPLSCELPE